MRVSSLFRRTQMQGLVIAGNDDSELIGRTERSLERRQGNSSNPEVPASKPETSATEPTSSVEPEPIAKPSTPAAAIPSSAPDPTTLATSEVKAAEPTTVVPGPAEPTSVVPAPAVLSTLPEVQQSPTVEAAPVPSTSEIPSSAPVPVPSATQVPESETSEAVSPPSSATSVVEASSTISEIPSAAITSAVSAPLSVSTTEALSAAAVETSPLGVSSTDSSLASPATSASDASDVASIASSAIDASSADQSAASVASSLLGVSNTASTMGLTPAIASAGQPNSGSATQTRVAQTGGVISKVSASGNAASVTGTSNISPTITSNPISGSASGSSISLADILTSSAPSQALIPVSALTGSSSGTLINVGSAPKTASIFAEAQSAAVGTGADGGIILSSVGPNGPDATGTGGLNTLSATAQFVKKPANIAGIVVGFVVGVAAFAFGIFFLVRRIFRSRRIGRQADTPPQSPLLPAIQSPLLPIGIAKSMSQRAGGDENFWSGQGTGGMDEKGYGIARSMSPAPLSPLPGMPRENGGVNGLGERKDGGNDYSGGGGFSLFPPPIGGRNGNAKGADISRDF